MSNFEKLCQRNNLEVRGRRYSLSQLISESYQTLYSCELDSPLYRLTESHIADVRRHPDDLSRLSNQLEVLKGLSRLGESAKIQESDISEEEEDTLEEDADLDTLEDKDVINEDSDMDTIEDRDVINEDADMETLEDKDVINEDADMETLDDKDVINEDSDMDTLEDRDVIDEGEDLESEDDEITPEELQELKKHLKEIRRARESAKPKAPKSQRESRSWTSERSSMTKALKNFRESSTKKAFFKSFSKLHERMKEDRPLSLDESLLLYKASNSTMTHLAVELEHNPEFIYTFRECTALLARDNESLLECIRRQEAPSQSLIESYKNFSSILLESEDFDDEISDEEEEVIMDSEKELDTPTVEEPEIPAEEELEESEEEEEIPAPEEEMEESEEEVPADEPVLPDEPVTHEEEMEESEEEDMNTEITDDEAEELRKMLAEIRKGRR